jgi:hypothetical protein
VLPAGHSPGNMDLQVSSQLYLMDNHLDHLVQYMDPPGELSVMPDGHSPGGCGTASCCSTGSVTGTEQRPVVGYHQNK